MDYSEHARPWNGGLVSVNMDTMRGKSLTIIQDCIAESVNERKKDQDSLYSLLPDYVCFNGEE